MSAVEAPDLSLGDRVIDTDPSGSPSAMRVVDLPGTTAEDHYIPAIGKTVAAANPDQPKDDCVVGVAFENALDRAFSSWREEVGIDAAQVAEVVESSDIGVTIYHFPVSRTEVVSEEWEAPAGTNKTSGRREREETFGDHDDAVGMFIRDLRRALSEPEAVAEETLDMVAVDVEAAGVTNAEQVMQDMTSPGANVVAPRPVDDSPQTRGECRHSRNDKYRPEDDDAMCCWECSNRDHNRPEKFKREDSAGETCSRGGQSEWKLRDAVMKNIDLSGLPDSLRQAYDGDSRRLVRDITALRSGDDDRIRKAALRMAYRPHLGNVEEYNYSRASALLRDRGVAAELPIIGDSGGDSQ